MPKDTAIDLALVSNEELIGEFAERHEEIIVVREDRKDSNWLNIRTKTGRTKYSNPDAGFDLILAVQTLHTAIEQLIRDYLNTDNDDD